ncbi:epoxyqueuosine reductase QueH [Anaerococcus sp.]|uniref:epoxyqueuosine reductase QueH n=1 Tax=Anaerococcus sp. TaxID=1872515 RepID=UPI002903FE7D|nr:epoxyqueuosine reductase QueH [Anaerococcus sp.]MDU1827923.1 epoxyqueuosine reductase QueH [Anaerococcus sp.]MDU1863781.1 epoxyqueuosine reductase QueH [Anaerococcus sp.]
MNNINYNVEMEKIIEKNKKEGLKPKLLMQVCCAPCSTAVMYRIKDDFDIDMFYYNPMIYPRSELDKRTKQVEILASRMGLDGKIIVPENNITDFANIAKKRRELPEGGKACYDCYKLRLEEAAKYTGENDYDYFCTTLSISPYKNSKWINQIGKALEENYGVKYLYSDFKKRNGYKISIDLSKQYDLYRQSYCGCIFSYKEMQEHKKNINQEGTDN